MFYIPIPLYSAKQALEFFKFSKRSKVELALIKTTTEDKVLESVSAYTAADKLYGLKKIEIHNYN